MIILLYWQLHCTGSLTPSPAHPHPLPQPATQHIYPSSSPPKYASKELWVERLLAEFEAWQAAGTPEQVWPRLEHINREIKHMLLDEIGRQRRRDLAPVLRSWFTHEVRKVRTAINHTLQALGERPLSHPR